MKKSLVLAIITAAIAVPAFAADSGPFVALDAQNWSTTNNPLFGNPSMGLRVGGGYQFTRNIGIEADYAKSGDTGSYLGAKFNVSSVQVAAVGTFPINDMFDVYAKLGMASNKINLSGPGTCNSCSKTNLMYGVGGQYNINKQVGIRLEYDQLGKASNTGTDDLGASTLSAGVVYNF